MSHIGKLFGKSHLDLIMHHVCFPLFLCCIKNQIHPQRLKISSGNESQYAPGPEGHFPKRVPHVLNNEMFSC